MSDSGDNGATKKTEEGEVRQKVAFFEGKTTTEKVKKKTPGAHASSKDDGTKKTGKGKIREKVTATTSSAMEKTEKGEVLQKVAVQAKSDAIKKIKEEKTPRPRDRATDGATKKTVKPEIREKNTATTSTAITKTEEGEALEEGETLEEVIESAEEAYLHGAPMATLKITMYEEKISVGKVSECAEVFEKTEEEEVSQITAENNATALTQEQAALVTVSDVDQNATIEVGPYIFQIINTIIHNAFIRVDENRKNVKRDTEEDVPLCFTQKRHTDVIEGLNYSPSIWRISEDVKTVSAALVLFLQNRNFGKNLHCARLECWTDPSKYENPKEAAEIIGNKLEKQYECLQFKTIKSDDERRIKCLQLHERNDEQIKRTCSSLRLDAGQERIIFYYNGHGTIASTPIGAMYVLGGGYFGPYHRLLMWDVIKCLSTPSCFIYDCHKAGRIVIDYIMDLSWYIKIYEEELEKQTQSTPSLTDPRKCIYLAACGELEMLPIENELLPADLFTACLTSPIKMAMYWHILNNCKIEKVVDNVDLNLIERTPGTLEDRTTMLGELNWIFSAVTDTIAWNTVPRELFHQLYRRDEVIANLFRNFLLAERIMGTLGCTPVTYPELPSTYKHCLWKTWDSVLDFTLLQLPDVICSKKPYQNSSFFKDQLALFEIWQGFTVASENREPPEQLPILLQLLINTTYRMQALKLLVKFLDLGPWAMDLALSVGILPYILQLLKKKKKKEEEEEDIKQQLVFIWAKILAVDSTCQEDLFCDDGYKYFIQIVKSTVDSGCRIQAAFVLASLVDNFKMAQSAAANSLIDMCLEVLSDPNAQLRQWVAICLARAWDNNGAARGVGIRNNAHTKLHPCLRDPCPEVRAAAVYALGTFIHSVKHRVDPENSINMQIAIMLVDTVCSDMSPLVRQELVASLQWIVLTYQNEITIEATTENRPSTSQASTSTDSSKSRTVSLTLPTTDDSMGSPKRHKKSVSSSAIITSLRTNFAKIWAALCSLETDPHTDVAQTCCAVMDYVRNQSKESVEVKKQEHDYASPSTSTANFSERDIQEEAIFEPLVTTQFVPWACKRFAEPLLETYKPEDDPDSQLFHEKYCRLQRNARVHSQTEEEYMHACTCNTYTQVFTTRCTEPSEPIVALQFHPYDLQIAVANGHRFLIWDWSRKQLLNRSHQHLMKSKRKITALQWVNGHHVALIMSAFNDGIVELWRPMVSSSELTLVSVWRIFHGLRSPFHSITSNVLLSWEQCTQTLITSSPNNVIRLWNAEQELHAFDIPTGSKSPITCLNSSYAGVDLESENLKIPVPTCTNDSRQFNNQRHGLIVAGFADGGVRLFDRRCPPGDHRIMTLEKYNSGVLGVQLRGDYVISGCANGYVHLYDIRGGICHNLHCDSQIESISAMAIHRKADVYAGGSEAKCISIYNTFQHKLSQICTSAPVSCLAFHPHKVMLAAGTTDSSVTLYCMEPSKNNDLKPGK